MANPQPYQPKGKILVVDDDLSNLKLLNTLLTQAGYRVQCAPNGPRALEIAQTEPPDLILLDIMMPEMDGYEVCRVLKADEQTGDIPVIFISVREESQDKIRAFAMGGVDYITKPFEVKEVVARVQTHLTLRILQTQLQQKNIRLEQEIAEHRQAEAVLQESEARYKQLLNSVTNYIYTVQVEAGQPVATFHSPTCVAVTGYTAEEYEADPHLWHRIIYAEDQQTVTEQVARVLAGEVVPSLEHRLNHKDGSLRWVSNRLVPRYNQQGQLIAYDGLISDISQRVKTGAEMRKLSNAVEQTADSVIITDRQGVIEYVNPAFERTSGYTKAEVRGKTPRILKSDQHNKRFYRELWETILSGQTFRAEFINCKKGGELYYEKKTITPLKDSRGNITHFIATANDITARKLLEKRLEAVYRLGQELIFLHNEVAIIERGLKTAGKVLQFNLISCGLVNERAGQLEFSYHWLNGQLEYAKKHLPLDGEQGISVAVVRIGQALNVANVRQDSRYVPFFADYAIRSELCVPLQIDKRIIGVLNVESTVPNQFTAVDRQLLQTLADQTAVALENARLYAETQRRAREMTSLNKASRALTSSLDLNTVLKQLVVEVKELLAAADASILLPEPTGTELVFAAVATPAAERLVGQRLPAAESIAGRVMQQKSAVLLEDAQDEPHFYNRIDDLTGTTTRSLLAVPLIYQEQVIGVIEVINKTGGAFNRRDLELLEALSSSATIAIKNARLHSETEQYARQLIVLHKLNRVITASLELDDVYNALARNTARLLPFDRLSITLLQNEEEVQLAYATGEQAGMPPVGTVLPVKASTIGRVIKQGQPILLQGPLDSPNITQDKSSGTTPIQSSMVIPLQAKGQIIGTLNISSYQATAYSPAELTVGELLADQLAIAIENARHYRAEQEQFRRLQQFQAQLIQTEKMVALGRLTAAIAHEINNPLQAIQNSLTLLKHKLDGPQRHEKILRYLNIADEEIERISIIIRRMRDFYRPTRPDQPQAASSFPDLLGDFYQSARQKRPTIDLHPLLEDVLQLVGEQLQYNGVTVESSWADPVGLVQGNPDHLKQVFLNLVLNAIDAMAAQGGTLYVRTFMDALPQTSLVSGVAAEGGPAIRLEFSDTGEGMPPETVARIFEPFFTTKENGSGLGLATSYQIIKAHQGAIAVESQPGLGTTFTILLPVRQP